MKRRKALQSMTLGAIGGTLGLKANANTQAAERVFGTGFSSDWQGMKDMTWIGSDYWANRLQDWRIASGKLECLILSANRNVHLLTYQMADDSADLQMEVDVKVNSDFYASFNGTIGFSIGLKGRYPGYQSACNTGKGINVGFNQEGRLIIGEDVSNQSIATGMIMSGIRLKLSTDRNVMTLSAIKDQKTLATHSVNLSSRSELSGNLALLVDSKNLSTDEETWKVQFSDWSLHSAYMMPNPAQAFGPIYFTQYTLELGILKITAQIAPIDLEGLTAKLYFKNQGKWKESQSSEVAELSRTAHFRVEDWKHTEAVDFRVDLFIPGRNIEGSRTYSYEGSIAAEPLDKEEIVALAMSCNGDFGFPDQDIVKHSSYHKADVVLFLGDQIYEGNGGYGVQNNPPYLRADLDFMRKWILFGWSYRDLFRNRPSICLPDDHDVFHGNVWGEGGKQTIQVGTAKQKQDSGGYKLPAPLVNMVQQCQTSHMPDPYDDTVIKQGISVYYTSWKYGGIDFAIIEDRKFKSAPLQNFPKEADVENGFAQNHSFDFAAFREPDTVEMLGRRQIRFLEDWTEDWTDGVQMKALLSATSFITLQTLPLGTKNDSVTGRLEIPPKGKYIVGDAPTRDMDSNGWPAIRRDEVVKLLRKSHAVHIVGDQHLASVAQYGADAFGDSSFVFTVPALGNIFPRRWWPPASAKTNRFLGRPEYTGDFQDGFGNRMSVHAAANPYQSNRHPAQLYDRATGYGVVKFHKTSRAITFECWPRYMDPATEQEGQYSDWPIQINQTDNFANSSPHQLPTIQVNGIDKPVCKIYSENGDLVSTNRWPSPNMQPKVLNAGTYTLKIGDPDINKWKEVQVSTSNQSNSVTVDV